MRIQVILLTLIFSLPCLGSTDQEMNELFKKYEEVMIHKDTRKIDEVFSEKFLKSSGGKKEFLAKLKELKTDKKEEALLKTVTWKKGKKGEIYFARFGKDTGSEFIIIKERGKLKIDGTVGDAE